MRSTSAIFGVLTVLAVVAPSAFADIDPTSFGTTTGLGKAVYATFLLDWNGTNLSVDVTDTSSDDSVITGWALMGGSTGPGFSALGTLDDNDWFQAHDLSMSPGHSFGVPDFGADTPPGGLNAGDPNAGILGGTTASFTFLDLDSSATSALDFLTTLNNNDLSIAARWQTVGANIHDSAKTGGASGAGGAVLVPAPGAALLALVGLSYVTARRKRNA